MLRLAISGPLHPTWMWWGLTTKTIKIKTTKSLQHPCKSLCLIERHVSVKPCIAPYALKLGTHSQTACSDSNAWFVTPTFISRSIVNTLIEALAQRAWHIRSICEYLARPSKYEWCWHTSLCWLRGHHTHNCLNMHKWNIYIRPILIFTLYTPTYLHLPKPCLGPTTPMTHCNLAFNQRTSLDKLKVQ